ncbi:MAG: aminotransferase class I/II-fold pyridoxal phosphate-dependent enzyme [Eubacteriales bacterium]|nr:aminotransferase class I/II-fold pyridoxal phosphate-dependent enzyme [Eubacteriales bacterium]
MSKRFVNSKIQAIPPSGIRKFFDMAGSIPNVISLGIGEPDFVTPYKIRRAAIDSLLDGETQYTENAGLFSLRQEIAEYLLKRHDVRYNPKTEIMVTVGASEAIDLCFRAILEKGDEVILQDPGYISYAPCVTMCGGIPVNVKVNKQENFELRAEQIEKHITPKTKAILLSYPNNPTGSLISKASLEQIADLAQKHDLLIISDEIYNELVYDGKKQVSIASLPGMKERCVTINGFSKAFAMTGHRVGYMCAPEDITKAALKIHQFTVLCASRTAQTAALVALKDGKLDNYKEVEIMRESYNQRRRLMHKAFIKMGLECVEPQGAFYAFPSIVSTGLSSDEFCERLLKEESVVCVPGTAFGAGGEGHIRCCYATSIDKLKEAFARMERFILKLGGTA